MLLDAAGCAAERVEHLGAGEPDESARYRFVVTHPNRPDRQLATETAEQRDAWLGAIAIAIARGNLFAPGGGGGADAGGAGGAAQPRRMSAEGAARRRSIVEALEDTTTDDFGGVVSSPRAAAAERRQTAYRLPRVFTRGVDAEWEETFTKIWNL